MKLTYFQFRNFGDALNQWLFPQFAPPGFVDDDESTRFYGIGTILGLAQPSNATSQAIVFSSGYSNHYDQLPDPKRFEYACVRGPQTARALHLPDRTAIADGAYLLRFAYTKPHDKKYEYSFMPHVELVKDQRIPWDIICQRAGVHYIAPMRPTLEILAEISMTRVMIAEAMHAAIVADTLRVPWIPCCMSVGINRFKWSDFCESVDLPYRPTMLPLIYSTDVVKQRVVSRSGRLGNPWLNDRVSALVLQWQAMTRLPRYHHHLERAKQAEPHLSSDRVLDSVSTRLMETLETVFRSNK